jgi:Zn finger protein HypA/HybF involved in hydrogenase expression
LKALRRKASNCVCFKKKGEISMIESEYVGIKKVKGKLACKQCGTVEPEVKTTTHIDGVDFYTWAGNCTKCGNAISITKERKDNWAGGY